MATFNGAKHLAQQLDSLDAQTHRNWVLIVSDDGSTDDTLQIVQAYGDHWGDDRMRIRQGPRKGVCQNFLSMANDPPSRPSFMLFVTRTTSGCQKSFRWRSPTSRRSTRLINPGFTAREPRISKTICGSMGTPPRSSFLPLSEMRWSRALRVATPWFSTRLPKNCWSGLAWSMPLFTTGGCIC